MEFFYYEIIHTAAGKTNAERVEALIANDPTLAECAERWAHDTVPPNATLYALIVIMTEDIADDERVRGRVIEIASRGFPVYPIVESLDHYDFGQAPIPQLGNLNARGLDQPDDIVSGLLHHGGLRRHGGGGKVMISYARSDGRSMANALKSELDKARFNCFIDERDIPGAVKAQDEIQATIETADVVILVDSRAAARSPWVESEMDMALVAHVPVVAVTPSAGAHHHALFTPHVPWKPGEQLDDVAQRAALRVRHILARRLVFSDRVRRALDQLCRLRGWRVAREAKDFVVDVGKGATTRVACSPEHGESIHAVMALLDLVGDDGRGLVVAGTRPYPPKIAARYDRAGRPSVRTTPLPRVATRLVDGIADDALAGQRIFLSAALPDTDEDRKLASDTLPSFVVTFVQTMFALGATIVYGGHPSVTPLMHKSVIELLTPTTGKIELHQGLYWRAKGELPKEVSDRNVFEDVRWHGQAKVASDDLDALRSAMIAAPLDAAVFVGGVESNPVGGRPGIIDEYERFRRACPDKPAFVVGLAGGAAAKLIAEGEPPPSLIDPLVSDELAASRDPDLTTALILAELLGR